ncbi:MAG: Endo-1,4-beta-xylanase/feruloyl esterase precursor [Bacteroidetes bacterium]|nr:Endo-1,4-beta-xylanase/feruloyl esterase precursor [Bacteroidota bacterium]
MKTLLYIVSFWTFLLLAACSSGDDGGDGDIDKPVQFTQRYNGNQSFYSKKLGQIIKYSVLLPSEYLSQDNSKFGVVYLLHGWGGDESSWGPSGMNIQSLVDTAEKTAGVRPLIYVMPQGFNSYFCNKYDGEFNYMDMITDELIPMIDKQLRTTASSSERAIAGFSMGGFGALTIASQHPELFKVSIGLSPSLNSDEQYTTLSQDSWNLQWGTIFGGVGQTGNNRITSYYKSQCPLHFFADKALSSFQDIRYFIDCGDDEERLYVGNGELHALMRDKGIKHEFRVRNGAHTEEYWRESMKEALPFIESSFSAVDYSKETTHNFSANAHSYSKTIKVQNLDLELWMPNDYNESNSYKILYYSKGASETEVTAEQVAISLDSIMGIKKFVIAGFDAKEMKENGISFAEICSFVQGVIHTDDLSSARLGLAYGSDADYLYKCTLGDTPQVSYFFAEDANVGTVTGNNSAKLYYLDITDNGTNYTSMFQLFCALRAQNSTVQYRVRNGISTTASAMTGIYSMSYFISEQLIKK